MKNDYPNDIEKDRPKKPKINFNIKNGEELARLYLEKFCLLSSDFEKSTKLSINEFDINPLFCVTLLGFTWQRGSSCAGMNLKTLQDKDIVLLLENNSRGGPSSVQGDGYVR